MRQNNKCHSENSLCLDEEIGGLIIQANSHESSHIADTNVLGSIVSVIGQEEIKLIQSYSDKLRVLEKQARSRGDKILTNAFVITEKVESVVSKLREAGISQKAVSKASIIKLLTGFSRYHYDHVLIPIWDNREYLLHPETERATSMSHALRIVNNFKAGQEKSETSKLSKQTKKALIEHIEMLTERIAILEADNEQKDTVINQLFERLERLENEVSVSATN